MQKEIPEFEAKLMLERVDTMLNTVKAVQGETDAFRRVEILKTELSALAPDAATLISRSDILVLMLHSTQPSQNVPNVSEVAKLQTGWASVREEFESHRRKAVPAQTTLDDFKNVVGSVKDWLDMVSNRITVENNHDGDLQKLK